MSHNKQQRRINGDHQMADGYEDHEEDTHHIHEGLTNHPIRNKNTKNNNVRGSHSEKPNKRLTNGMMNNQPLYSITKPQNYLEEVAKEGIAIENLNVHCSPLYSLIFSSDQHMFLMNKKYHVESSLFIFWITSNLQNGKRNKY